MKKSNVFTCWAAAACLSLGCLALSGCTTTQAQADADDIVTAGALPASKSTCTKGQATSCRAGQTQCTRSGAAQCSKSGLAKDSARCCKSKKADSDT